MSKFAIMKPIKKLLLLLPVCTALLFALTGCVPRYTFNGSALDYSVYKTIHVANFPIRAALVYPPLQQTFEGEITQYYLTPQAVTEDAYASRTRLTIGVRIKYTDNKAENKDIDQSFTAYRDFDSSQMLTDVQDELCQQISEELVQLIFNATLGNW